MPLQLPKILEPLREKIESTLQKTVRIHPRLDASPYLWQSKIGGKPYWPKNLDYPQNSKSEFLFFLAQLNFAEMPPLEGFPQQGILQFFIANDGMFGIDFDQPQVQDGFRVRYHAEPTEDTDQLENAFAFLPSFEENTPFPAQASFGLDFTLEEEYLGPPDYRFDQVYPEDLLAQFIDNQEEIMDFFYELGSKSNGHKVGGYAFFTQYDPRDPKDELLLLFQLDSDSEIKCMWGDMGIANFFIPAANLKALNFDHVLYNWDCA